MNWLRNWLRKWLGIEQVEARSEDVPHADCLSLDFIFSETKEMLLRQWSRVDALDNKAGLLAGFDGVIIAAAVGLLPILIKATPTVRWLPQSLWIVVALLTLGLAAVMVSFLFAAKAFRVQSYHDVLNPETAYDAWIYWHERETKMQLRSNLADGYKQNEVILDQKAAAVKTAMWALLIGLVLFCASAVGFIIIQIP